MLVYVGFFILTFVGGVFSGYKPPPCDSDPPCPKNEHYTRNNSRCIRTCANNGLPTCGDCKPFTGCVCDGDLVRLHDDGCGPCVPKQKCPQKGCKGDMNATWSDCPSKCPATCCNPDPKCTKGCADPGCVCKKGFILSKPGGPCIRPCDCPAQKGCKGDMNATWSDCPSKCPATCCNPDPNCTKGCADPGCVCKKGFILSKPGGPCIRPCDCPAQKGCKGDMNATWSDCPSKCPATCCNPDPKCTKGCADPGCVCKKGFILSKPGGPCIRPCDCPVTKITTHIAAQKGCKGDMNATWSDCPSKCPATCCNPDPNCTKGCADPGCVCKKGFILSKPGGPCIRPCDCPAQKGCKGDMNATWSDCPSKCPATCCNPDPNCTKGCADPGCVCKKGLILSKPGGPCIRPCDCPAQKGCKGDMNATWSDCPSICPATCCNPDPNCTKGCADPGCVCKKGFILSKPGGPCIRPCDCPAQKGCKGDMNATWSDCPSKCPATCCNPDPKCTKGCADPGCVCKKGFILSKPGGPCIRPCDCPAQKGCKGDMNATWSDCPSKCPATCRYPDPKCTKGCADPGCVCKKGFILSKPGGPCIRACDCPAQKGCKGDMNATWSDCPSKCPATCRDPDPKCTKGCADPGCVCKKGFILSKPGGPCIRPCDCPAQKGCKGDMNATWSDCPSKCPATCRDPDPKCTKGCADPGCVCKKGFILSKPGGPCIRPCDCPAQKGCKGDMNATWSDCPSKCPATCRDPDPKCTKGCADPGCVCKKGFILSKPGGPCIRPCDCPVQKGCKGDMNATWSDCPNKYPATCRDPDPKCTKGCADPGCVCKKGFILSKPGGPCIRPCDCPAPKGCKGDMNATWSDCPNKCPATCRDPDPKCTKGCADPGCVCKRGFILSKPGGPCIRPCDCPAQIGCKGDMNATWSVCPSKYPATCHDPDQKCTKGCADPDCVCKKGFILSKPGGLCIRPCDCPAQKGCKGDMNATWSDCPSKSPATCRDPDPKCTIGCADPGCVCKKGYILSKPGGPCIRPCDCPAPKGCKGDMNATWSDCPSKCPATCRDPDTNCSEGCADPGCVCKKGFILSKLGGLCIRPCDCPAQKGCKGDMNATWSDCPSKCPATCRDPDPNCTKGCAHPGCVCKKGFILSKPGGRCIRPCDCPAEKGCKGDMNATWSDCPSKCPATCRDPDPNCTKGCAHPGCVCKKGFILSKPGGRCIRPCDCPAQKGCKGDMNATWSDCPSKCPATCRDPDPNCTKGCAHPGCVCKKGFILSKPGGRCIRPCDCPAQKGCKGDMNATWSDCPSKCPATCRHPDPNCTKGCAHPSCVCKKGFILSKPGGRCIRPCDCPAHKGCKGDMNATWSDCPSKCPATCCNPDPNCTKGCADPGCVCKKGFILSKPGGLCIRPCDCPEQKGCKGDMNATWSDCPSKCPATCCDPDPKCTKGCADPGCVCKKGFVLSKPGGPCIRPCDCPEQKGCKGDMNATWSDCPSKCPATCCDPDPKCTKGCADPGCVCKKGFILSKPGGPCIRPCDCPAQKGCKGDMNATWSDCPSKCPATCCDPDPKCTKDCADPGCVCNEGFMMSEPGGPCIRPYDCEGGSPVCCDNMTFVNCKIDCRMKYCPEDENEIFVICDPVWPCPSGCACKPGYLMPSTADKRCILAADCPARECTRPNEVWDPRPSICNYERCDQMYYTCGDPNPGRPKCVCKEGYYKDNNGVCIPAEDCPNPQCGYNEVAVPCRQICPPQNCEIAYTDYACTEESKICEPGCNCLPNHLRNGSGICIPNEECPYPSTPVCGINEIARDCRRICPPQTCLSKYALFRCVEDLPCEPGCDCVRNYLRDDRGICIPSEQCPAPCQIPDECKRTCAKPNPPNCEYNPPKVNRNGCDCKDGYILSELGGDCIPIDQCPPDIACHGDSNARPKRCPKPCPSTCKSPNQVQCKRKCDPIGCQCKPGYILSNATGLCILPNKCPGGNPCGKNAHFADCKTDCARDYCPVNDNRDLECCDPPAGDCLSGCVCNLNYRRKSRADPRCIVSSDCPRINCTRPNEKWSSCPSACLAENCEDIYNQPTVCNTLVLNCDPRCICKKDHFRNSSGICIPAKDCPKGCKGDPNAVFCNCPSSCEPTCTNPNPEACTADCKPPGCVCKQGFVLNEENGKCIEPKDCQGCGGDPNAVYKDCPTGCEPTCANRNPQVTTGDCKPSGCVCKTGFVLNEEDGKCIDPDCCPEC